MYPELDQSWEGVYNIFVGTYDLVEGVICSVLDLNLAYDIALTLSNSVNEELGDDGLNLMEYEPDTYLNNCGFYFVDNSYLVRDISGLDSLSANNLIG